MIVEDLVAGHGKQGNCGERWALACAAGWAAERGMVSAAPPRLERTLALPSGVKASLCTASSSARFSPSGQVEARSGTRLHNSRAAAMFGGWQLSRDVQGGAGLCLGPQVWHQAAECGV